jgi:hypothetical protein
MKKRFVVAGMLSMALALGMVVTGCASTGGVTPTYKLSKTTAAGLLNGKKAVVFDFAMSERDMPGSVDTNFGGGIPGGIMVAARIGGWKSNAKAFDEELSEIEKKMLPEAYAAFTDAYKQAYGAETAQARYDFGGKEPALTFFNKPNKAAVAQITKACQDNSAEYAVTIIEKIVHGQINNMNGYAITQIKAEICVFDKTGAVVAQVSASLPNLTAGY